MSDIYSRMNRFGDIIKLMMMMMGAFIGALSFMGAVGASLFQAYGGREFLRDGLGITELHLLAQGEDGIIHVQPPRSYAATPVSKSDPIVHATYYARRTERGVDCVAQKVVFVFSGSRNNPKPGKLLTEIIQITREWSILDLDVVIPDVISTGPVIMAGQVTYQCPWGVETTTSHPFNSY